MIKEKQKALLLSTLMVLYLAVTALSQSPQKKTAEPVGVVITNSDRVMVNGAPAQRGSTILSGSEIQTGETSAFVNFTTDGGVLSIAPGSRVKISRDQARLIAEVLKGSVTVRSPLASTVIAPDRVIDSEPDNLYTVTISDSGTTVESLLKSVAVKTADGAVRTIAAQAAQAAAATAVLPIQDQPGDIDVEPVTPVDGFFVTARCMLRFRTLMVSGIAACRGVPVAGARITLRVFIAGIFPLRSSTSTNSAGRYKFTITEERLVKGGRAQVTARTNQRMCMSAQNSCMF